MTLIDKHTYIAGHCHVKSLTTEQCAALGAVHAFTSYTRTESSIILHAALMYMENETVQCVRLKGVTTSKILDE